MYLKWYDDWQLEDFVKWRQANLILLFVSILQSFPMIASRAQHRCQRVIEVIALASKPNRRRNLRDRVSRSAGISWYTFFFYKHKVHKHTQPQIGRILSTLLSTAPASDLEVNIKVCQNLQFFLKIFSGVLKNITQMIFSLANLY